MPTNSILSESGEHPDFNMADNDTTIGLRALWEQELLLNLTVQVDDRTFRVHKIAVIAMSDYFRTLMTGSMAEEGTDSVQVKGISAGAMENLIKYMYTGKMDVTQENVSEILAGALYLLIKPAVQYCTSFLISTLDTDNWSDVLTLCHDFTFIDAAKQVKDYIKRNIQEIVKTNDNSDFSHEVVCFIVGNWQSAEYDLFRFISEWVNADGAKRKEHEDGLLSSVRFCLMTHTELAAVKELKIYHDTPNSWAHLVEAAVAYHKLPIYEKVLNTSEQNKVRSPPGLVVFPESKSTSGGYYYDDLKEKHLIKHEGLKLPILECGGMEGEIEINNFLVVCSGRLWFIFDPRTLEWTRIRGLFRPLLISTMAYCNGYLYVIGGSDSWEEFFTIERYHFSTDTWEGFGWLPHKMRDFGACILNKAIYICGGDISDFREHRSDRVYRMEVTGYEWELKAPMLKERTLHSVQVMKILGEKVMCIFDDIFNLEYYSDTKDQWSRLYFSFNIPPPPRRQRQDYEKREERVRGNLFFPCDILVRKQFKEYHNAFAVVKIPEEGTDVVAEYVHQYKGCKFEGRLHRQCGHYTVLSIAAHVEPPEIIEKGPSIVYMNKHGE